MDRVGKLNYENNTSWRSTKLNTDYKYSMYNADGLEKWNVSSANNHFSILLNVT